MTVVKYFNGLGGLSAGPYVKTFKDQQEALRVIEEEAFIEGPDGEIRATGMYSEFAIYRRSGNRWRRYMVNYRVEDRPVLMPAGFDPLA